MYVTNKQDSLSPLLSPLPHLDRGSQRGLQQSDRTLQVPRQLAAPGASNKPRGRVEEGHSGVLLGQLVNGDVVVEASRVRSILDREVVLQVRIGLVFGVG